MRMLALTLCWTVCAALGCGDDADGTGPSGEAGGAPSGTGGIVGAGGAGGAPATATCPPDASAAPGDTAISLQVGALMREFYLHVPASYAGDSAVPLVVDLHPFLNFLPGDAADFQRAGSGWLQLSDQEGFIVAHPQGIDRAWNLGTCCTQSRDVDDVAFILALVEHVKQNACVDPRRVYATGYSNGGGLSHLLACRAADVFAAIAPAAFDLVEEILPCTPSRPLPVISFRGLSDGIVPYAGGNPPAPPSTYPLDPVHFLGAVPTFDAWSEIDGCTDEPQAAAGNADWECQTRSQCQAGTDVTLCTGNAPVSNGHGQGNARLAWDVFARHSMP